MSDQDLEPLTPWQHIKIEEGDIIMLRPGEKLDEDHRRQIEKQLQDFGKRYKCKFVLIPHDWTPWGIRIKDGATTAEHMED